MSKVISTVKEDLTGLLHSTTLSSVTNPSQLFSRVARTLLSKISPPETVRIGQISNAVHDDIFDYDAPDDLRNRQVIDIRPQINRGVSDSFSQRFNRTFDKYKANGTFNVRYNNQVKTLRLSESISPIPITLHGMDSLTANGTWAATADATNLTLDQLNYMSGSGALNFDLLGVATTGYIENSDFDAVDLENLENIGKLFVRVYIPDPSIITNFILSWGSSSTAFWTVTVTSPHDQSTFKTGWQILAFDWNGATKTLSPDSSAINYLKLLVTVSAATAETDLRVDKITASSGNIYEIEYYSEYLFTDSAGTLKATTDANEDYLILDDDTYNIFLYEAVLAISQQKQGADAGFDRNFAKDMLYGDGSRENLGLIHEYKVQHPDQAIRPRSYYYRFKR